MVPQSAEAMQRRAAPHNLVPPSKHASTARPKVCTTLVCATAYRYPDGGEVTLVTCTERTRDRRPTDQGTIRDRKTPEEWERENARRAAVMIRRRARAAQLTRLWTLTFPAPGVHDYRRAAALFDRWMHDYGAKLFRHVYVAVPELHPGGHGWHWHILTRGHVSVNAVRRSWTRFLANRGLTPSGGARWIRVHVAKEPSPRRAARYVAKYIVKTIGAGIPKGMKRYRYGIGTSVPQPTRRWYDARPIGALYARIQDMVRQHVQHRPIWCWCSWEAEEWDPPPIAIIEW